MKERSKEKIAELVMDELLTQLSERGNVRKLLGDMTGLPIGPLVEDLIREFEEIVERYRDRSLAVAPSVEEEIQDFGKEVFTPTDSPSAPLPVLEAAPLTPVVPEPSVAPVEPAPEPLPLPEELKTPEPAEKTTEPAERPDVKRPLPKEEPVAKKGEGKREPKVSDQPAAPQKKEPAEGVVDFRSKLEELARRVENEYLQKLEQKAPKKKADAPPPPVAEPQTEVLADKTRKRQVIDVGPGEGGRPSRIPFRIDDEEFMYIHGVMIISPGDPPCEHPFMLEEKGIDGKEFAFAIDVDNHRFFLSKINQKEMNVSRKGVLLLGKAESIQLRGLHQGILNELRAHGIVLPMEFGTVARGKADLQGLASRYQEDIQSSLESLAKTSWWTLSLSVLDARIAQLFADETGGKNERDGRQRERVSYSAASMQSKKFDVKLLEKILQKEKRLAESVHQELSAVAERSEVQNMVGLGSGSSDDWKMILRASYLVSGSIGYQRFTRAVTDLQYRHILFEPVLSIEGDAEDFSFLRK